MGLCGSHPARLGGQRRPCAPPRAPRSPGGRESPRPAPAPAPGGPMLLLGLLLLTSALAGRRPGTRAEPSLSLGGKFQLPGAKEQNGVQNPQHERVITVATNGSIHSPRFPHAYPRNTVLVWRLVAVEENVWIQLTFDERFGLEDPEDDICKYDFVEVEEPSDGSVLGRWCGSGAAPGKQISKGNQIRIRFVSDEYFPAEPGFCIHYSIVAPQVTEAVSPSMLPPSALPLDLLNNAVTAFSTLEDLIRYLEPERWQLDLEDLYRPSWQLLGKAFVFGRKSKVVDLNLIKEEVKLYSCTPRNFSVSIREELKRTDTIFWPGCLLVKRCGGNCACCLHSCSECQCVPSKVTKKYHEVLQLRPKTGIRGLHKSLTDIALEHHEECGCVCRGHSHSGG
ncbi:platelet-derived growth factor C isoform X2 [Cavia porcellus]|uniref:platelet-derived growth factor C isoform X2 n=1 Tax=Cavia porcellus TaxID=10141 RepID=UPI002FE03548